MIIVGVVCSQYDHSGYGLFTVQFVVGVVHLLPSGLVRLIVSVRKGSQIELPTHLIERFRPTCKSLH